MIWGEIWRVVLGCVWKACSNMIYIHHDHMLACGGVECILIDAVQAQVHHIHLNTTGMSMLKASFFVGYAPADSRMKAVPIIT